MLFITREQALRSSTSRSTETKQLFASSKDGTKVPLFKFVAAMQAAQACDKPILIRVETLGSHGYRPTDKRIAELADQWALSLAQMKVTSSQ